MQEKKKEEMPQILPPVIIIQNNATPEDLLASSMLSVPFLSIISSYASLLITTPVIEI
jgi:hypothetical protein